MTAPARRNYDVIVAGGGLGGLTAAARLAKAGRRVLLVEQHYTLGGYAHTFKRKEFNFEVSLEQMDGPGENELKHEIFGELGISDKLRFVPVPEFYRIRAGKLDLTIPHRPDEAMELLKNLFPADADGIENYFAVITGLHREITSIPRTPLAFLLRLPIFPFLYPNLVFRRNHTVGEFIDRIISDETLKIILLGNLFFYHDDPHSLSLLWYGVAQGSYFADGGSYIHGGSSVLSQALADVITSNGGKIVLRHEVREIIVENGAAVGVKFVKHRGEGKESREPPRAEYAKKIVVNASLPETVNRLLPHASAGAGFADRVNSMRSSLSTSCVYFGLNRGYDPARKKPYSTIIIPEEIGSIKSFHLSTTEKDFSKKILNVVDYSAIDSGLAEKPGKSCAIAIMPDTMANWENLSREKYEAKKDELIKTATSRAARELPGFKNAIEYVEASTPMTNRRFTMNPRGEIYGFAQTVDQSAWRRPMFNCPGVKNLFFASAWTQPGGGFTGAIMSGWMSAGYALK